MKRLTNQLANLQSPLQGLNLELSQNRQNKRKAEAINCHQLKILNYDQNIKTSALEEAAKIYSLKRENDILPKKKREKKQFLKEEQKSKDESAGSSNKSPQIKTNNMTLFLQNTTLAKKTSNLVLNSYISKYNRNDNRLKHRIDYKNFKRQTTLDIPHKLNLPLSKITGDDEILNSNYCLELDFENSKETSIQILELLKGHKLPKIKEIRLCNMPLSNANIVENLLIFMEK